MKNITLLFALIAILTSCSKNEDLLPVPPNPNDPSLRTSSDQYFLYTIEEDNKYYITDQQKFMKRITEKSYHQLNKNN